MDENRQDKVLTREEAIVLINDEGEHKFFFNIKGSTPVYIIDIAREKEISPRLHEEVIKDMVEKKIIPAIEEAAAGYCRVYENELLYWGETSFPSAVTDKKKFNEVVDKNGILIIDQWLGSKP